MLVNAAARVISGRSRFCHITDFIRHELHWLPVVQRTQVATLVYKAQHDLAPKYIKELLVPVSTFLRSHDLRSCAQSKVIVPKHRTKYAERAFAVAGPSIWNSLPQYVRDAPSLATFRIRLKKHLFDIAYYQ